MLEEHGRGRLGNGADCVEGLKVSGLFVRTALAIKLGGAYSVLH